MVKNLPQSFKTSEGLLDNSFVFLKPESSQFVNFINKNHENIAFTIETEKNKVILFLNICKKR